jgi:hypothetical protein
LAFVSNRSGKIALWTRKPGRQPDELPSTGLNDIERPVWSPDGSRIAFFEAGGGKITVHVVTALGQEIVSFDVPSIGYGLPNWTPDGEHLVMFDKRILQVVRIDLRDPSRREPVQDKLWVGTAYYHGATYSSSGTTPGLWQMDGAPRLVTPNYPIERQPRFTFMGDDVLLAESRESGNLRILAQPLNGAPSRLAYYAPAAEADTPLAVNPLTGDVIYVSEVAVASHIHVLTIARQ